MLIVPAIFTLRRKGSGIPVKRVTAIQMRTGLGGWIGKDTDLDHAGELDLVWWTWIDKPHRPHGHVGVFLIGRRSELLEVTHSSSSQGCSGSGVEGACC